MLRAAFPDDGRNMRRWLRHPGGAIRCLLVLDHPPAAVAPDPSPVVQGRQDSIDSCSAITPTLRLGLRAGSEVCKEVGAPCDDVGGWGEAVRALPGLASGPVG